MTTETKYRFYDGFYQAKDGFFKLLKVEGDVLSYHNDVRDVTRTLDVEYGDFGATEEGLQ